MASPAAGARTIPIGLVLPILAAAALSLFRIGEKSLWIDETFSLVFSSSLSAMWDHLWNFGEINMAAYYVVLGFWRTLGDTELVVRLLSAIFAVGTIPVVYAIAERLIGGRSAAMAALLLALHPMFVQYAQEARAYSFLVFVTALSTLLLLRSIERPTMRRWLVYGAVTGLTLYVHLFGFFIVPAHGLLALLHIRSLQRRAAVVVGFGTALLVALPGLVVFALFSDEQLVWLPAADAGQITSVLVALLGGGPTERPQLRQLLLPIAYGAALMVAVGIAALAYVRRSQRTHSLVFLVAWAALPVVASLGISLFYKPVFLDRYLIVCLPALALLGAAAISRLSAALAGVAFVAVVLFSASGLHSWFFKYEKEDWRAASAYLVAEASDGDAMAFYQPWAYPPVFYYAERLDQVDALPEHIGPRTTEQTVLDPFDADSAKDAASRHSALWLVLSHNEGVDEEDPILHETLDAIATEFTLTSRRAFANNVEVLRYEAASPGNAP